VEPQPPQSPRVRCSLPVGRWPGTLNNCLRCLRLLSYLRRTTRTVTGAVSYTWSFTSDLPVAARPGLDPVSSGAVMLKRFIDKIDPSKTTARSRRKTGKKLGPWRSHSCKSMNHRDCARWQWLMSQPPTCAGRKRKAWPRGPLPSRGQGPGLHDPQWRSSDSDEIRLRRGGLSRADRCPRTLLCVSS
jgi:hypothetical protein